MRLGAHSWPIVQVTFLQNFGSNVLRYLDLVIVLAPHSPCFSRVGASLNGIIVLQLRGGYDLVIVSFLVKESAIMVKTRCFRLGKLVSHRLHPVHNRPSIYVHFTLSLFLFVGLCPVQALLLHCLFCSFKCNSRCIHRSFMDLNSDPIT